MLRITNGRVLTFDSPGWYENGAVVCEGGLIAAVGEAAALAAAYPQAEVLDAQGGLILPGLINTHNHIYSALARGLSVRGYAPQGFTDILEGLWWTLDRQLNNQDNRISARITAVDCIKNGVTTIFDHHASYGEIEGSLDAIADELLAAGLRCCLCYELSDRDGADKARAALAENIRCGQRAAADASGRLAAMLGLHASFTLSDETLEQALAARLPAMGCHIHVAEGQADLTQCQQQYGQGVVERLYARGVLGPQTIAAHCIHISPAEIELLQATDTMVVHNPESNMGNAVGCPPTMAIMKAGVLTGLGTDGYTNDMLESFKVANILHKHSLADCNAAWAEAPQMLFVNNARIAGRYFPTPLGRLAPGCGADVIVCDYQPITPMDAANAYSHLLFGVNGRSVTCTVAAGRVLMKQRVLTGFDEAEVAAQGREQAQALWRRINH